MPSFIAGCPTREDCRLCPLLSQQLLQRLYEWPQPGREAAAETLLSSCAGASSGSFAVLLFSFCKEIVGSKVKDFRGWKKGLKRTAFSYKKESTDQSVQHYHQSQQVTIK